MNEFKITVTDQEARNALAALEARVSDASPVLRAIGEGMTKRIKGYFSTSTGPDGQRWASNSQSVIEKLIARKRGFGKKGITKKGQALAMGKKPLIDTKELSHAITFQENGNVLEVGTARFNFNPAIAAALQFGTTRAGKGHNISIPARPWLPITQSGDLYPVEHSLVIKVINEYLAEK